MLSALLAGAIEDAAVREEALPLETVLERARAVKPPLEVVSALSAPGEVRVIAEIKRASPSRGDLAAIADPVALAREYESGGASVISVLTEGRKFKGSLEDLQRVKQNVSIPVLRKDFIGNRYQIAEARLYGADLILLIVAALDEATLRDLYDFTLELGMTPLVETHSAEEVEIAVSLGAQLIGVNARNLKTFELDTSLFGSVQHLIPADAVKIAESAVLSVSDVTHYRKAGADAVLIGEALATAADPRETLQEFITKS